MKNLAATIPAEKAPLEIQEVESYTPGPDEILIKNEVIGFVPLEAKIVRLGLFPLQYPAIIGFTCAGTIEAVGSEVTGFKVGEKVVATKARDKQGNQYCTYQQYLLADPGWVSKVPDGIDPAVPASLVINLLTVIGVFQGKLDFDRPSLDGPAAPKNQKVLIYGGSSGVGSLAVPYLTQAGYQVVTTTSPKNKDFVSKLNASVVLDHTQDPETLTKQLKAEGPYAAVVDTISFPNTVSMMGQVLAHQGGGTVWCMTPPMGQEDLPEGVDRWYTSWPYLLLDGEKRKVWTWALQTYLPQGLARGQIVAVPIEKVPGGLKGIDEALDRMLKGVSGVRLVADPWE
jgi:NADPH:quinone reductase-like Zn-dependent oxidoreductase